MKDDRESENICVCEKEALQLSLPLSPIPLM